MFVCCNTYVGSGNCVILLFYGNKIIKRPTHCFRWYETKNIQVFQLVKAAVSQSGCRDVDPDPAVQLAATYLSSRAVTDTHTCTLYRIRLGQKIILCLGQRS